MSGIVMVRHGETEWNRVERFRGRMDLGLNQRGQAQAEAVGRALAPLPLAAVYSSPLRRAWDTAVAIAAPQGLAVHPHLGLMDIDYGEWQGLTPEEVGQRYPELHRLWLERPQELAIPGGESLDDVRLRAVAALEEVLEHHHGQRVVLVSHKVVCKLLLCHVLGLSSAHFWRVDMDTGGISRFELRGGRLTVAVINDRCHLSALN